MPSIRSLSTLLFSSAALVQSVLGLQSPVRRASLADRSSSETCTNAQLSCHNKTAVANTCCFNSPGGSLLQVQFWDYSPAIGPSDHWTIHGLWPDNCDGTYGQYCDSSREYKNISAILKEFGKEDLLSYMRTYWQSDDSSDLSFWNHEWDKHGTCVSTLEPDCFKQYKTGEEVPPYFQRAVDLFKSLPTYKWLAKAGIKPSNSQTYSLQAIQQALSNEHGHEAYIGCDDNGALNTVYYYFNVRGSLQDGTFVSAPVLGSMNDCPEKGIKYPVKPSSS